MHSLLGQNNTIDHSRSTQAEGFALQRPFSWEIEVKPGQRTDALH